MFDSQQPSTNPPWGAAMVGSKAGWLFGSLFQRATRGTQMQQQQAVRPDPRYTKEAAGMWGAPCLVLALPPCAHGSSSSSAAPASSAGPASSVTSVHLGAGARLRRLPSDVGSLDRFGTHSQKYSSALCLYVVNVLGH